VVETGRLLGDLLLLVVDVVPGRLAELAWLRLLVDVLVVLSDGIARRGALEAGDL